MPANIEPYRLATRRNLLLFAISFALGAGLSFNIRPLILLGECLLVLAVFAWWQSGGRADLFRFERKHHPRCFEDDEIDVEITCLYTGKVPLDLLEIQDTFPPGKAYFVRNLVPSPLMYSHELQLTYENVVTRRRALYTIGPIRLTCHDGLGIFHHEHEMDVFSRLYVYPKVPEVEHLNLLEEGTLRHVGHEVTPRVGRSEEFRSIREYRPGDPLNHVHWPSTARHGHPMVKEFDDLVVTDVSVFLDLNKLALRGVGDVTSVESMIKAAAATVRVAIVKSHRVQVFAIGRYPDHIPPAGGWPHLLTVLDRMTLYRAGGRHDFAKEVGVRFALLPPGGTVVLIVTATNFDLESMRPIIDRMIDDRMRVVAVVVDDRSFLKLYFEQEATHIRALQLPAIVRELKRLGCRVFTAESGDDLRVRMEMPR